jgi:RNA polymerase sigma-70 factor, ECF subfamily
MPNLDDHPEPFLVLVTRAQRTLHAFILKLVPSLPDAEDILQQTNLVLWSKQTEFTPGTNFRAWAFRVARYQVMAHRKRQSLDRLVFREELIDRLACRAETRDDILDAKRDLLIDCFQKLSDLHRKVLDDRYADQLSGQEIADKIGSKVDSVFQTLHRARQTLLECIELGLRENGVVLSEMKKK